MCTDNRKEARTDRAYSDTGKGTRSVHVDGHGKRVTGKGTKAIERGDRQIRVHVTMN